jgi:hypothetical protein
VSYDEKSSGKAEQLEIINNLGQVVVSSEEVTSSINISHLTKGVYHIRIKTESGINFGKFLKN